MDTVRKDFPGTVCRRCLNRYYHINLKRQDCKYGLPHMVKCDCCGKARNIVTGLKLSGRLKMMFQ